MIHEVLTKSAVADLSAKAKFQLAQACQQVSTFFSEEHGAAVKSSEGEAD